MCPRNSISLGYRSLGFNKTQARLGPWDKFSQFSFGHISHLTRCGERIPSMYAKEGELGEKDAKRQCPRGLVITGFEATESPLWPALHGSVLAQTHVCLGYQVHHRWCSRPDQPGGPSSACCQAQSIQSRLPSPRASLATKL